MKIVTNGDDYVTDLSCCGGLVFPSRTVSSSAAFLCAAPGRDYRPPSASALPSASGGACGPRRGRRSDDISSPDYAIHHDNCRIYIWKAGSW